MSGEVLMPPWLRLMRTKVGYLDSTGRSVGEYTGLSVTAAKGGDRLRASIDWSPQSTFNPAFAMERAAMQAFLFGLRGQQGRAYLHNPSQRRRGSFATGELLGSSTFINGINGFSVASATALAIAATDRRARLKRLDGVTSTTFRKTGTLNVVPYAPYVARAMVMAGRGPLLTAVRLGTTAGGNDIANSGQVTAAGLLTAAGVPLIAAPFFNMLAGAASGGMAHDYFDVPYVSVSRCALVDNPSNLLLRSDQFDSVSWTKTRVTVTGNSAVSPDGSTTADSIIEDATASNTHFLTQTIVVPSAAADFAFACALKAGTRTWARLVMIETSGSESLGAYFDLANGVVGATTTGGGSNWSDVRTAVVPLGDGWFYCCVIGRKANAATGIRCDIRMASANNSQSYSGDNASLIYGWRATAAQSSMPMRLTQSTSTLVTDTAQTGSALYTKGWPASTSGLLLPMDQFEVVTSRGSELKLVTNSVDSDAAGMSYVQFVPPLRGTLADNAPVIVYQPMGRYIFTGQMTGWDDEPGIITRASADFEEAA